MKQPDARVVMLIIDALPHRHVSPATTPALWQQVVGGGRAPQGALSLPLSVTYGNHAAFVTGADPLATGVFGNHTWDPQHRWVDSPDAGPCATTLFDRCSAAGRASTLVVGDQHLVGQMGGSAATHCWPPGGELPHGVPTCPLGYAADVAVEQALSDEHLASDLVVVHLNEPDTTEHLHGPDSAEALAQYRSTDQVYGRIVERLARGWDRTVLLTLSDHDQETIDDTDPVDIEGAFADLGDIAVVGEGTGALLCGPVDPAMVRALDGVESIRPLGGFDGRQFWTAWTDPGRTFGAHTWGIKGQHGSPRCRTQVAVVSGGHPAVDEVARQIECTPPSVLDWAPLVCDLTGL